MIDMDECIFCKIVRNEIPSEKIYEDSDVIAFLDINPRNPGHTLILPKKHYQTLMEMPDKDMCNLFLIVKKISRILKEGMKADGISINQSNDKAAGQVIPHVHVHVIPRFYTEGPPGLESMLPVKKMDKATLDCIAKAIKSAFMSAPISSSHSSSSGSSTPKLKKKDDDLFEL